MKNLREVKDDLLKEWIEFREETTFCEMSPQDKKYLRMYLKKIKNMFKSNLMNLIKILWTIYITGMKSIIEMVLLM